MRVLIIEDEIVAARRLQMLLKDYDRDIELLGALDSIEESVEWFSNNPHPDILMLDLQLADGFGFNLLKQISYRNPVIFTTAYGQHALEAFSYFSVDYLLKPVTFESLKNALDKYRRMTEVQDTDYRALLSRLKQFPLDQRYKERFLARVGQKMVFVKTTEIAYFRAEDKLVCLVDKQGNRLPVDYTLEKLETLLDPAQFFRLNRKIIVSIDSIAQVKPYFNSRLALMLKNGQKSDELIISRERVAEFKQWAES